LAANYKFVPNEFTGSNKDICKYCILGLFGSTISVLCGAGPGAIIGPALIAFNLNPQRAIATGMYTASLITISSTILVFSFDMIKLDYAIGIAIATALGTLPGIYIQLNYMKNTRHQVMIVLSMFTLVLISM